MSTDGEVSAVYGDGRMGKSTFARGSATDRLGAGTICVYSTPNGDASDPCDWPETEEVTIAELRGYRQLPFGVVLRGEDPEDVCELVRELASGYRVIWICDEAQEVFPHGFSSKGPAGRIFHASRHLGVDLVCVTRWPSRIDTRVFYASTRTIWFRLSAHRNLEWVAREYGECAAREVAQLEPFRCITVDRDDLPRGWQRWADQDVQEDDREA